MTRSMFCSVLVSATLVASVFCMESLMARGKEGGIIPPLPSSTDVRYRVNWIAGPVEATEISPRDFILTTNAIGVPVSALVVGHYRRSDRTSPLGSSYPSGFVYDVLGSIDPDSTFADPNPGIENDPIPNKFWDIEELVGPTPAGISWVSSTDPLSSFSSVFRGVNSAGLVAGYVTDKSGNRHAVYIRLDKPQLELVQIPDAILLSSQNYAADATESGDILITASNGTANEVFVYQPDDGLMIPFVDPVSGLHFQTHSSWPNLSSMRDFVGLRNNDARVFRHSMLTGQTNNFLDLDLLSYVPDCNELGDFVSQVKIFGKGARYKVHAIRVDQGESTWIGPADTQGVALNDDRDVLVERYPDNGQFSYFHAELQALIPLSDLIIDQSDPNRWFRDAGGYNYVKISNRDDTGFGWIVAGVGGILQPDGSTRGRMALLIPEIAEAPTTYTFTSPDIPKAIPDLGTVTSTIVVPEAEDVAISDLNVTLNINHERAQDMDVFLISPTGRRVELFTDVGGNGVNFTGTTLDSQATTSITSGSAPFTGTYRPEVNLSDFNGLRTLGTWKLELKDDKALKTGTLLNWSFTVQVN